MFKFTFKIENPPVTDIYFNIIASTPAEAVEIANQGLAEAAADQSESLSIHYSFYDGNLVFKSGITVNENQIVNQEIVSDEDIKKAHEFLIARGYESSGELNELISTDEVRFTKSIYTEDGRGIYALFQVSGRYRHNIERIGFKVDAILYPVGLSQLYEDGTLNYSVQFHDRQAATTIDELPNTLEHYEAKFMELILALRKADPFDGLPLPDDDLI